MREGKGGKGFFFLIIFLIMHLDAYLRYMEGPARFEQPPDPSNLGAPPPQAFQMIQVVMKDKKDNMDIDNVCLFLHDF